MLMEGRSKKKRGTFQITLGVLLLVAALGLIVYNRLESDDAYKSSMSILDKFYEQLAENQSEEGHWNQVIQDALDTPDGYEEEEEQVIPEMPVIEIDGRNYLGTVEIPSLGIELPILADWDFKLLKIAPARYRGNYFGNDLVIAAHNYARHFSPIKRIEKNADVYLITATGDRIHYRVKMLENLNPSQGKEMVNGDWDLTMFTCNTGGRTRCAVRCIRVEE